MSSSYGCGLYGGSNWTISTSSRIIPRGNSVYGYLWTSVSRRNACDSRIPIVLFRTITEAKILEARRNGRNNDPNSRSSSLKLLQATNPICANSSYQCFWNVWNQSVNQLRRAELSWEIYPTESLDLEEVLLMRTCLGKRVTVTV